LRLLLFLALYSVFDGVDVLWSCNQECDVIRISYYRRLPLPLMDTKAFELLVQSVQQGIYA
jgi:hypothetical protein